MYSERHPLDKEVKAVDLGFIGDYIDLSYELTGAPKPFHQLAGLASVSSVMHNATLPLGFRDDLRPNLYGAFIAPSSVYYKSTALRQISSVMDFDALLNCKRYSAQFTEEGLFTSMAEESAGIVIRDEIGMLFASHRKRYLETVTQALTQIYDGDSFAKSLAGGDSEVKRPYLNIIGATTPARFFDSVREVDWQDGFMPRWLFAVPDGEPNFDFKSPMFTTKHQERRGALSAKLIEIHRRPVVKFKFTNPNVYDLWSQWQNEEVKTAYHYEQDDKTVSVVQRYSTYALKFAMILSAAHGGRWGMIDEYAMQNAISLADNYKTEVYRLMTRQIDERVDGGKTQEIFLLIRDWGRMDRPAKYRTCTRRNLQLFGNISSAAVRDQVIQRLLDMGAITERKVSARTKELVAMTDKLSVGRMI